MPDNNHEDDADEENGEKGTYPPEELKRRKDERTHSEFNIETIVVRDDSELVIGDSEFRVVQRVENEQDDTEHGRWAEAFEMLIGTYSTATLFLLLFVVFLGLFIWRLDSIVELVRLLSG